MERLGFGNHPPDDGAVQIFRKGDVRARLHGGPLQTAGWDVSTNGKAAFLDEKVEDFMRSLPDDGKLRVAVKDGAGTERENIFATTGFGAVRGLIAKACLWPK